MRPCWLLQSLPLLPSARLPGPPRTRRCAASTGTHPCLGPRGRPLLQEAFLPAPPCPRMWEAPVSLDCSYPRPVSGLQPSSEAHPPGQLGSLLGLEQVLGRSQ